MKNIPLWAKRFVRDIFAFNSYDPRCMRITSVKHKQDDYGSFSFTIKGMITRECFQSVWSGYTLKEFMKERNHNSYDYNGPGQAFSESNTKITNRSSTLLNFDIYCHGGLDI